MNDLVSQIKELEDSLEHTLRIDTPQFEDQARRAAHLMSLWGRMYAKAKLNLRNVETAYDIWYASTEISVREYLDNRYVLDRQSNPKAEKPTESKVKAFITKDKDYASKRKEVNEAQYFVDLCEKAGYEPFKQQCYLLNVINQIMLKQK